MAPFNAHLDKIREAAKKLKPAKSEYDDSRIWKGVSGDIIRFLPSPADDLPWVQYYSHGFKENTAWVIGNCPSTVFSACPVCEHVKKLQAKGSFNLDRIKRYARRPNYVTNILVVKDQTNPSNNGSVCLFQYGVQVADLYGKACQNEHMPFDPHHGKNFQLVIGKKNGYPNYESCLFSFPSALCGGDQLKIMKVLDATYPLAEFVHESRFQNYYYLSGKMADAVEDYGGDAGATAKPQIPSAPEPELPTAKAASVGATAPDPLADEDEDSGDEEHDPYFDRLATQ